MDENSENIKKKVQEKTAKLAEMGSTLAKNQFSYKIEEKISKEYWQKRIENLTKYNEISLEYYSQIQNLMNLINQTLHHVGRQNLMIKETLFLLSKYIVNAADVSLSLCHIEIIFLGNG